MIKLLIWIIKIKYLIVFQIICTDLNNKYLAEARKNVKGNKMVEILAEKLKDNKWENEGNEWASTDIY